MRVTWGGVRITWGGVRVTWGGVRVTWGGVRVPFLSIAKSSLPGELSPCQEEEGDL